MTAKEALEYFKRRKEQTELNDRVQQAEDLAIKALEKQIPRKPKKNLDGNLACQCGFVVQNGKNRKCIYYCTYCGQRLDWGDIE